MENGENNEDPKDELEETSPQTPISKTKLNQKMSNCYYCGVHLEKVYSYKERWVCWNCLIEESSQGTTYSIIIEDVD